MKLALISDPLQFISLPNDLLWEDEFSWSPLVTASEFGFSGTLFIDQMLRQKGRPITLVPAQEDMGWVARSTAKTLLAWAKLPLLKMKLTLEYPDDTREFEVIFRPNESETLTAKPVVGFPGFADTDWFSLSIKLMEI